MPDWRTLLASRLAPLALPPAREREIIEELAQHLNDRYGDLLSTGAAPEEAMHLALDEINDEDLLAREMRPLRPSFPPERIAEGGPARGWLSDARQDFLYAARMLRKSPGFAAAAILTLALGIGANSAIFSLVNATLLERLPVQNRERLSYVFSGDNWAIVSYPAYIATRDAARLLDGLAAWGYIDASLNVDRETDVVGGAIVTGNFFEVLGLSASQGRLLSTRDDVTPMAHAVAVISHRLWQSRFGGRADIVGHEIRLNGRPFTIVGVTPPAFPGPQLGATRDIYVPMMMQPLIRPPRAGYSGEMDPDLLKNPNNGWLFLMALRKQGVTDDQAAAELSAIATTYVRARSATSPVPRLTLVPIDTGNPTERARLRAVATLLACVVGAVLLIACANVANLLLSKAAVRRREVAIRLALGASRWRIVRQLLTESMLLAMMGGAAGLLLAWLVIEAFEAAPPPLGALPIALDFAVDGRVLLFSLALSVVTGLVFGVAPALQTSRSDLVPALRQDAFVPEAQARRFNLKNALVVAEVALSLMLLIAAGLFIRSLGTVQAIEPGYAVDQLVSTPLNIPLLRYTRAQGREFYRRVIERMEQIPGVRSATVARIAVLTGGGRVTAVAIEGRSDSGSRGQSEGTGVGTTAGQTAMANVIGPDFFATLGIPFVRGRDFASVDTETTPLVAIVSESMAKQFFPGEDAIGKRFSTGYSRTGNPRGDWVEIVGVARNSKYASLSEPDRPVVYMPLAQRHETGVTLYVRASGALGPVAAQIRREIQAIEPNLPVADTHTMTETIATSLYAPRMGAMLLALFGGLALLLASVGIYGVLAFSIARRTREIGIRVALGADRRSVTTMVLRQGMSLVGLGLAIGLGAGFYLSQFVKTFLFDVSPRDLTTFATVPCVLAAVALVACYVPARRALRVDPLTALKAE
jgi:putative ABC transport system permease protein